MNTEHSEHVETALDRLRAEVENLQGNEREQLESLVDDLASALRDPAGESAGANAGESATLRARVEAFEVTHPTATGVCNRVLQSLADIGI